MDASKLSAKLEARLQAAKKIVNRINNYEVWVVHSPDMVRFDGAAYRYGIKPIRGSTWVDLSNFQFESEAEAAMAGEQAAKRLMPAVF